MDHIPKEPAATKQEKPGYNQRVPAVAQASKILFCLAKAPRSRTSLTEICRQVGIHKSKGYSILNTLIDSGLVVKDQDARTYSLGPALLVLSRSFLDKMDLREVVAPFLEELAAEARSTALLGLINGDRVYIAARHEASAEIGITIRVGHRYPLTWGAHGKAILAFLPEGQRRQVLASKDLFFHGRTADGAIDPASIEQELNECRRLGYAKDLGRVQQGVNAVSAPIHGSDPPHPIGCLIVVGTFPEASADALGEMAAAKSLEMSSLLGPTMESIFSLPGLQRTTASSPSDRSRR